MSKPDGKIQSKDNGASDTGMALAPRERELMRAIRCGSVMLTLHDGHLVEIQKTERIRRGAKGG